MEATCGGDDERSGESSTATRMSEFECEEVGLGLGRVNVMKREGVRVSKVDASIIFITSPHYSYLHLSLFRRNSQVGPTSFSVNLTPL